MRVFREVNNLPPFRNGVLTIGTFDGVHMGHQQIIQRINSAAREIGGESILLTFHPHPRLVINPNDTSLKLLNTLDEKIALLEHYGVENLIVAPFSKEFSQLTAAQYVEDFLLDNIKPRHIVIGYDHRFGHDRQGGIELLTQLARPHGVTVEEIPKQTVDDIAVSSTKVRNALLAGEVDKAGHLLGHLYSVSGTVVRGRQNGKAIGYPTANIEVGSRNKLVPERGIYTVRVKVGEEWFGGMLSIGTNPTFAGEQETIEVHIFDFDRDIYGREIAVEFVQYLRDEIKFDNLNDLVAKMQEDERISRKMLN